MCSKACLCYPKGREHWGIALISVLGVGEKVESEWNRAEGGEREGRIGPMRAASMTES